MSKTLTLDKVLAYDNANLKKQFYIMSEESKGKGDEEWNDGMTWDEALMCIYNELGERGISLEE